MRNYARMMQLADEFRPTRRPDGPVAWVLLIPHQGGVDGGDKGYASPTLGA